MRKRIGYVLLVLCGLFLTCCTEKKAGLGDMIVGKWCNPYTYHDSGELKGFEFKKGGECAAINIPSLDLKTWELRNDTLIVKGFDVQADGSRMPYETQERISQLTRDSLTLVVQEKNPRIAFLYLNMETLQAQGKQSE